MWDNYNLLLLNVFLYLFYDVFYCKIFFKKLILVWKYFFKSMFMYLFIILV